MALQQSIQNDSGASSEYWRVARTTLNYGWQTGEIELCGYLSAQDKANGRKEVMEKEYNLSGDLFDLYFSPAAMSPEGANVVSQGYVFVKGHAPEFIDAVDILE